ncbi:MAG: hypothetical protein RRC34_05650 [Lentisphaeria bacterium]|nr:hypothetical protein [Lentisphaeria bacterium]
MAELLSYQEFIPDFARLLSRIRETVPDFGINMRCVTDNFPDTPMVYHQRMMYILRIPQAGKINTGWSPDTAWSASVPDAPARIA